MTVTTLLIMRHAKSSWDHPGLEDHQRPLNKRGRNATTTIARALNERRVFPQTIWSSDSVRTQETCAGLCALAPPDLPSTKVEYFPTFYLAGVSEVLAHCHRSGEPECETLMLLGHNPGWSELVEYYSGESHPMPTAACAIFKRIRDQKQDWLSSRAWTLSEILLPRDLENLE